jgi:hypothetical protein
MFAALLLAAGIAGLAVALRNVRGGGRAAHPRCWSCGYDMRAAPSLTCPECGHTHADAAALMRAKRNSGRVYGGLALFAVGAMGLAFMAWRQPWYLLLPRPILRIAAREMAPPLPPAAPGSPLPGLPSRSPASYTPWGWLVWAEQVNRVIRAWSQRLASTPHGVPEAEIDTLLAAADQVEELYDFTGGMPYAYGWTVDDAKEELFHARRRSQSRPASAAPARPGFVPFDTTQWALAELQYDGDYSHRPDWTTVPVELLEYLLKSNDAKRRAWAIRRLDRRHPDAARLLPLVEQIIATDSDRAVRSRAQETLYWLRMNHDGRWGTPKDEP